MKKDIFKKIREKREFSQLPEKDIEMAYENFEKRQSDEDEKIKLTKELLRKNFSAFVSKKLLSLKNKEPEWILRKHISTRERLPHYQEIYKRIFSEYKTVSVIDLGAGINGFSFNFFKEAGVKVKYTAIESVGQLVELMNFYFKKSKLDGNAITLSLFEKEKVKKIIKDEKKPRVIFLFKVIDALEKIKRDYSKELISELIPLADKFVLSFATKSLGNRKSFGAKRSWILDFVKDNFKILDGFEIGGEYYVIFSKRNFNKE
jgi:hypothetical protein